MFKKFVDNFIWGAAISAEQTEGHGNTYRALTNWDLFFSKYPERFFNNIGPNVTSDLMHHYQDDIKLFKKIGLKALRYGFSWARIFPENNYEKPNKKAVTYYHDFIKKLKENGIKPFMSLVHFDIPSYLASDGGILSKNYVQSFKKYCQFIFQEFGGEVDVFITFNEPMVVSESSYLLKSHWPLEVNFKKMIDAIHIINLCNALAVYELRKINCAAKIGLVLNLNYPYPKNKTNKQDLQAVNIYKLLKFYSFTEPVLKGEYKKEYLELLKSLGIEYKISNADLEILKNNIIDFIGVNFYHPTRLKAPTEKINFKKIHFNQLFQEYHSSEAEINSDYQREIYPKALYDTLMWIKTEYNNFPMIITENGVAINSEERLLEEGIINDQPRINFIKSHLNEVYNAINNGANVQGYFMATAIDNWCWTNAYKNRDGFISINLEDQKRTIKQSGFWYQQVSNNNGFESD